MSGPVSGLCDDQVAEGVLVVGVLIERAVPCCCLGRVGKWVLVVGVLIERAVPCCCLGRLVEWISEAP